MMYGLYNGFGGMGWFGGGLFMFVFWALIILFIIWAVRGTKNNNSQNGSRSIDILEERYAKGEISKEEFRTMKKDILSN